MRWQTTQGRKKKPEGNTVHFPPQAFHHLTAQTYTAKKTKLNKSFEV